MKVILFLSSFMKYIKYFFLFQFIIFFWGDIEKR